MDITLIVFITLISLFFLAIAIFKQSPLMATVASILLLVISVIVLTDGIHIIQGGSGVYSLNLTDANGQITGDIDKSSLLTYAQHKNTYTDGLGLTLLLISLSFLYLTGTQNSGE